MKGIEIRMPNLWSDRNNDIQLNFAIMCKELDVERRQTNKQTEKKKIERDKEKV